MVLIGIGRNGMINIENDCCACDAGNCTGCRLPETPHYYCDICGTELREYADFCLTENGDELCEDCYRERYEE